MKPQTPTPAFHPTAHTPSTSGRIAPSQSLASTHQAPLVSLTTCTASLRTKPLTVLSLPRLASRLILLSVPTNTRTGYNISFNAESTAFIDATTSDLTDISSASSFQVDGQPGVPGTHLSVTSITDTSGGANILAFYQVSGNDVTEYTRDRDGGQWTGAAVPIPP